MHRKPRCKALRRHGAHHGRIRVTRVLAGAAVAFLALCTLTLPAAAGTHAHP